MEHMHQHLAKVIKRKNITTPLIPKRQFKGIGFIAGQITEQNRPIRGAIVQCVHSETNIVARSINSSIDGTFVFENLDETQVYHIVAIDPDGAWENKVSSRRIPRTTL